MSVTARAKEIRRQITILEDELYNLKNSERQERLDAFNAWAKGHYGKVLKKGDMFTRPKQEHNGELFETYWKVSAEAWVNDDFPFPTIALSEVGPRGGVLKRQDLYYSGPKQRIVQLTKTGLKRYKIKS